MPIKYSNIEHAATASATLSNETDEETGQVENLAHFLVSNSTGRLHEKPETQDHHRISLHDICKILLVSWAKPGKNINILVNERQQTVLKVTFYSNHVAV